MPDSGTKQALDAPIRGRFSGASEEIKAAIDIKVTEAVIEQTTRERTIRAVTLQDQGKVKEARELLMQNATEINSLLATMPVLSSHMQELQSQYSRLGAASGPVSADQLGSSRKAMRALQLPAASSGMRY